MSSNLHSRRLLFLCFFSNLDNNIILYYNAVKHHKKIKTKYTRTIFNLVDS